MNVCYAIFPFAIFESFGVGIMYVFVFQAPLFRHKASITLQLLVTSDLSHNPLVSVFRRQIIQATITCTQEVLTGSLVGIVIIILVKYKAKIIKKLMLYFLSVFSFKKISLLDLLGRPQPCP